MRSIKRNCAFAVALLLCCQSVHALADRDAGEKSALPLVYSSYFWPQELSPRVVDEIHKVATDAFEGDERAWFGYVRYSRGGRFRLIVYSVPTSTEGRLRRGNCIYLEGTTKDLFEKNKRMFEQLKADWPARSEFVQVIDKPAQLPEPADEDVADDEPPRMPDVPEERSIPMRPSKGVADRELPPIIDAARVVLDDRGAKSMPVRSVKWDIKNEAFEVEFGFLAGPLNGRGYIVKVRRKGDDFVADPTIATWIS